MAELMDRLLGSEWYLDTWLNLDDWPDTWAFVRDWKPTDPAKYPTDPMHWLEYGDKTVRDLVGFRSDGTAVVRRLTLADEGIQFSRSGPAAEIVDAAVALDTPAECCLVPRECEQLWGATTTHVLALFRARDWRLSHVDVDGGHFEYAHGVGSTELDRPRFYQGQRLEPLGISPLACHVTPGLDLRLIGWRVHTGCSAHRGALHTTQFRAPDLAALLDRFESAATTADLPALAYCVLFGDCSTRELDFSQDYPSSESLASPGEDRS